MRFTAAERETTIQWSDVDDGTAYIYTSQRRVMRRLARLAKDPKVQLKERHEDDHGRVTGEEWDLPLEFARYIFPGKKRQLSEAQREAKRQQMRAVRSGRRRESRKIA